MSLDSGPASELRRSLAIATEKVESIIEEAETAAAKIRSDAETSAEDYRARRVSEVESEVASRRDQLKSDIAPLVQRVESLRDHAQDLAREFDLTAGRLRDAQSPAVGTEAEGTTARSFAADSVPPMPTNEPAPEAELPPEAPAAEAHTEPVTPGEATPPPTEAPIPVPESPLEPDEPAIAPQRASGPMPVAFPGVGSATEPEEPTSSPVAESSPEDALLRATQLAVAGSSRADIEAALRSEFQLEDASSVVDGILGPEVP